MVTASLLSDLSALSQSTRLIIPLSSWAFWGGLLSNATEVHVNAPPLHPLMPTESMYTYHDQAKKEYFGKYNRKEKKIIYHHKEKDVPIGKKHMHNGTHTLHSHNGTHGHRDNTTAPTGTVTALPLASGGVSTTSSPNKHRDIHEYVATGEGTGTAAAAGTSASDANGAKSDVIQVVPL